MKKLFFLALLAMPVLSANAKEVKTFVTCQQENGDYWVEFGVIENKEAETYKLVLVAHSQEKGTKVKRSEFVSKSFGPDNKIGYINSKGDFSLELYRDQYKSLSANGKDQHSKTNETALHCYENSTIIDKD